MSLTFPADVLGPIKEQILAEEMGLKTQNFITPDDACGIPPETLEKIFEPFFTTKKAGKGTGLGLATVYGIVKQNNGFVDVYSDPEKGTTVRLCLPRYAGRTAEAQKEAPLAIPSGRSETILLVEDDASILKLGEIMFESFDFNVLSANSPAQALDIAEKHSGEIDLLITDAIMPDMNGRELSERLKNLNPDLKSPFHVRLRCQCHCPPRRTEE